jgi:hypothetical protein
MMEKPKRRLKAEYCGHTERHTGCYRNGFNGCYDLLEEYYKEELPDREELEIIINNYIFYNAHEDDYSGSVEDFNKLLDYLVKRLKEI